MNVPLFFEGGGGGVWCLLEVKGLISVLFMTCSTRDTEGS